MAAVLHKPGSGPSSCCALEIVKKVLQLSVGAFTHFENLVLKTGLYYRAVKRQPQNLCNPVWSGNDQLPCRSDCCALCHICTATMMFLNESESLVLTFAIRPGVATTNWPAVAMAVRCAAADPSPASDVTAKSLPQCCAMAAASSRT